MSIALCKCGIDMSVHPCMDMWEDAAAEKLAEGDHNFQASGTKYICEEEIETPEGVWLCPRPRYHEEHGVKCGPLTGKMLWQ